MKVKKKEDDEGGIRRVKSTETCGLLSFFHMHVQSLSAALSLQYMDIKSIL